MPSPWQSGLAKLDASLQPFQSQLERLQAGLEVSDAELFHSLERAQQGAAAVRDLILAERPDSNWSDRESLEQVIQQLEDAARERVNQQRRDKLLELANELEAGTVKHRVEARTTALNALRLDAVGELRNAAQASEQQSELPGPEASEWLLWAAGLEEEKDAATVAFLRRDYPTLERFAGELDERYWKPVARPESQVKASTVQTEKAAAQADAKPSQSAAASDIVEPPAAAVSGPGSTPVVEIHSSHNYRADKTEGSTTAPVMSEAPVNSTVNMFKVPSRDRSPKSAEEPKVEPVVMESITADLAVVEPQAPEASVDSSEETMPSFGVLSQAKRPAAIWIAAAAGVILLCAVFAGIYRSSAKASNSPGGAVGAKADIPPAAAVPAPPVAKQAVEGAQRLTALDLERCQRLNPGSVQCWGYVSNVGTDPARISLQSVDVVDGKGNTFNLHGVGQLDFATGRSSNISGGARAKYTVTVPDKDPTAKVLTLYVDVTNPHALEYTFRDIPIT
jgi:hypothetical protein